MIEPTLYELAKTVHCVRTICRNCYARNPPDAKNCRRCSSSQLRPKKQLKK